LAIPRALSADFARQYWGGRKRFVVLSPSFCWGHQFLAAWQAWRLDPQACGQLFFIAFEDLRRLPARAELLKAHSRSPYPDLVYALGLAWPTLTPDWHALSFENGAVQLQLVRDGLHAGLRELIAAVDLFDLRSVADVVDSTVQPPAGDELIVRPTVWDAHLCKALGRLAAPGAVLIGYIDRAARKHLASAGFEFEQPCSTAESGHMVARFSPAHIPRAAPARIRLALSNDHSVAIVGAGLAGCAAAWALAEQGLRSTLLERHDRIAPEASGNPAGLFHGIVHAHDGVYARFNRAAALAARNAVQTALAHHAARGSTAGLLRLETTLDVPSMRILLHKLSLPSGYVQALDAQQASQHAGMAIRHPAWFYPGGGWVNPIDLARSFLERAGASVQRRHETAVHAVCRSPSGAGWVLFDAQDQVILQAQTVVLANAIDAMRLLGQLDDPLGKPTEVVEKIRGQISTANVAENSDALHLPRVPVAGAGYLLPDLGGQAMFGATAQLGDDDPSVRLADHDANLAQLVRLCGHSLGLTSRMLQGRTAWRCSAVDRLPIIGAVPDMVAVKLVAAARLEQTRWVPRAPGLFLITGLGSRGITWSALASRVLASCISGAPMPLGGSLLDAIDPARFVSRKARRVK
jgi:tRNA 5-methylaminomethyl-2-thiouridine biosynthesis bifunctional protein